MKHLLRKLHIGGGGAAAASSSLTHSHDRLDDPHTNPPATASSDSSTPIISPISSRSRDADPSLEASGQGSRRDAANFNYLEEEYQVNLALAISVSDPHGKQDPDLAQMDAAKRISLGCPPVVHAGERGEDALANFLSLQYWNYNVLNYNEKVMDGFYDVYGIVSTPVLEGMIPSLVDLQETSISDSIDYEAVLVNRATDVALQQLEKRAVAISLQCEPVDPITSGLVQKIADLVVDSMGGPVGDPVIISERWKLRNHELKASLNTVVLPIGCLEVGLSRHRALLFKVLADRIDLPCRLVKGSYYTGTDEGAVNLIRVKSDSEYIIDLMGAPGTLIPSELPSSQFQNTGLDLVNSNTIAQTVKDLCLALDKRVNIQLENKDAKSEGYSHGSFLPKTIGLPMEEKLKPGPLLEGSDVSTSEKNNTERFEHEFGKLSLSGPLIDACGTKEAFSTARQMRVDDVSKYVVSAAKDPEFAQKLYAVLSERGTSTSPDLLLGINSSPDKGGHEILGKSDGSIKEHSAKEWMQNQLGDADISRVPVSLGIYSSFATTKEGLKLLDTDIYKGELVDEVTGGGAQCFPANVRSVAKDVGVKGKVSPGEHQESERMENSGSYIVTGANNDKINMAMDDVAECEIPWEDLQIGDRIGLGSCGEVLRADWNGTEVAVKKFLDQGLSGDALEQFRSEVKIMLRLRHPNVVLFMGAVTRPPNLSILTEFLPRGSLYRILHRPNVQLDEKRRLRMAMDVAKGMNYLHTSHPTIVHRDLKSPNLLVDKNWVVKVCDFGLSRLKHHTFLSSKSSAGTPEWMAPEVLRNEPSNEKSDVYSFGVILWELATLRMPWSGMNPMQVVGAVGFQNRRLDIPKEVDANIARIICDCWQSEPNQRPSFAQLIDSFKHLQRLVVGTGRSLN